MLKRSLLVQIAGPTVLVSLLLLGLSIAAAVYLYQEQALSASDLGENVSSAQIAQHLENLLNNLSTILQTGNEPSPNQHAEVQDQLDKALAFADKNEEKRLVGDLREAMARYFTKWNRRDKSSSGTGDSTVADARAILQKDAQPLCRKLEEFNTQESQRAAAAHRKTVQGM